jgi:hypothetical protein
MAVDDTNGGRTSRDIWMRGLFMLLFAFAFWIGQVILNLIALVQFIWLLVTKEPNAFLLGFGSSLAAWFSEIARFQSCATDEKPFPWRSWPSSD